MTRTEQILQDLLGSTILKPAGDEPSSEGAALAPMILIVEDDPDIACSLTIRLQASGFRSCLAEDATTAIDVARGHDLSCAILDVNIPGGDGFSVAEQLRRDASTADVPVIFLTASMLPDMRVKAATCGAAGFMTKPFDSKELIALVRSLV